MRTTHRVAAGALALCPLLAPPAAADHRPSVVTVQVSPVAIPPGGQLTLRVHLGPVAGGTVVVQERYETRRWRDVATRAVPADGSLRIRLGSRSRVGSYGFRVTGQTQRGLAVSSAKAVTRVTVTGAGRPTAWQPLRGTRRAPHRWTSCVLHYEVNPQGMPRRGMADLREALRRVGQVSAVRFEYAGTTSVVPGPGYLGPGPDRFVVAWADPATTGLLDSATAGRTGTFGDDTGRLQTGFLLFNTAWSARSPSGFGAGQPQGAVMMHEAGHLLGLGHAGDPDQIMMPSVPHEAAVWGAGDLRGLRRLGSLMGCLPAQPR